MATRGGGLQAGGLAEAALGVDPDELEDPSLIPVAGALEEVATPGERKPAVLPTQSRRAQQMTTGKAMERLDEARTRLTERLAAAKEDRTGEWLALAQGMLAPTRTGGFGESLGAAAGLVREARGERRKALTDIESDLLDAEVKQQTLALQARPRLGGSETVYHPDDVAEFPDNPEKWRQIEKQTIVHSDGFSEHIFTGTEDGEILQVVSKSNPITVREAKDAEVAGRKESERTQHDIEQGLTATIAIDKLRDARDIFARVETGGLKSKIASLGEFFNVRIADDADFRVLRRLIGDEVLGQLSRLTGTKTDFEYQKIESLNASPEASQEANLRIIDEMLGRYDRVIEIGERSALAAAQNPDEDLSVRRYREYRSAEEARAAAAAEQPQTTAAPQHHKDRLVELYDPENPNNEALIQFYRGRYGWPPVDPAVLSELRKKGYKD